MPNITNQPGVSIDSLQTKITLLEIKFSKLSNEHKLVQDSLKNLEKTLQKADIKTEIFTDQLAFQLFIFSCIIGVLAFFSWASILRPFQNKIKRLLTITIPKLKTDIKTEMDERFTKITKAQDNFKTLLYTGYIDNLRISVTMAGLIKDATLAFEKLILSIAFDLKFHGDKANKVVVLNSLEYAKELIESPEFALPNGRTDNDIKELEGYISFLTKHEDQQIAMRSFKILEKFLEIKANIQEN